MVKKSKSVKRDKNLRVSEESEFKEFSGNLLSKRDDEEYIKKRGLFDHTVGRRARYWCARFRREVETADDFSRDTVMASDAPKEFREFVESLKGFTSWKEYGYSWALDGTNPFRVVMRLISVWDEWDHVMKRVVVPIDASVEVRNAKMKVLTEDYAKKNNG